MGILRGRQVPATSTASQRTMPLDPVQVAKQNCSSGAAHSGHVLMTTIDQLRTELEALIKVYVVAARLRTFPVPFDDHFELVGAVDQCRSVLEPPAKLFTHEVSMTFSNEVLRRAPKTKEDIVSVARAVIARGLMMESLVKKLTAKDMVGLGLESSKAAQLDRLMAKNSAAATMLAEWLIQEPC